MNKLAKAGLLCVAVVAGGTGFWILTRLPAKGARAELATARAQARQAGIPLELADVRTPEIPAEQNAAAVYVKIGYLLDKLRTGNPGSPLANPLGFDGPYGPNLGGSQGSALRGILALRQRAPRSKGQLQKERDDALPELRSVFDLVPKLDSFPQVDFRNAGSEDFNQVSTLETLEKDLVTLADYRDRQGDWRAALTSMRYAGRVALDSGSGKNLTAIFVQESAWEILSREYVTLIGRHTRDAAFLSAVELQLPPDTAFPDLRRTLEGYIVSVRSDLPKLTTFRVESSDDPSGSDTSGGTPGDLDYKEVAGGQYIRSPEVQEEMETKWIDAWLLAWDRFPQDPHDWQGFKEALRYTKNVVWADKSKTNSETRYGFASLPNIMDVAGTIQARTRVLKASVALLRIRAEQGKLPDSLPLSLGVTGIDPFDGQPLRYRKKGDGFILYSIGESGKDDGGALMAKDPVVPLRDGAVQFM